VGGHSPAGRVSVPAGDEENSDQQRHDGSDNSGGDGRRDDSLQREQPARRDVTRPVRRSHYGVDGEFLLSEDSRRERVSVEIKRFTHIGMCVSDLERSLRFYTEGLGFEVVDKLPIDDQFGKVMEVDMKGGQSWLIRRDGILVELLGFDEPEIIGSDGRKPMNQRGFTHMALWVEDVDAVAERIKDFGGRIVSETRVNVTGDISGDWVYCLDPDGVRIELMGMPTFPY
jgi:glyoxylase I family protein